MEKESKKVIAMDIGGTNIRIGLVNASGQIDKITKLKKPDIKEIANLVRKTIKEFFSENELKNALGFAVASAGRVDNEKGTLECPTIGEGNISLGKSLEKAFGKEIILINDANAAAYWEYSKVKDKTKNLVYLTLSTGIGGGAIVNGILLFGADNSAAELGHISVKTENYRLFCNYGHENDWEAFSSGEAIPKFFKAWAKKEKIVLKKDFRNAEEIFEAAKNGDAIVKKFVEKLGEFNASGLTTIINTYNPEIVILGGSVVQHNQDQILDPMIKNINKSYKLPEIIVTDSGDEVCLLGAAKYAFENLGQV